MGTLLSIFPRRQNTEDMHRSTVQCGPLQSKDMGEGSFRQGKKTSNEQGTKARDGDREEREKRERERERDQWPDCLACSTSNEYTCT